MKRHLEFTVNTEETLLHFLLTCIRGKSRNYIKGILKRGQVSVDGRVCTDHAFALHPGQCVTVLQKTTLVQDNMSLSIIYEDDDLIVIDKPAGLLSIATDKQGENTAYRIVTEYVKNRSKSARVFIVHRLDRETSGVLLLAKNERMKRMLQDNWNEAVTGRKYIAVVEGKVLKSDGVITSWLKQSKTLLVYSSDKEDDGKKAITKYKTVKASDKFSLLEIYLKTGRKNQIRVHMSDLGHPVTGDKKYGGLTNPFGRLGLHASELIIKHPSSGKIMSFNAPTPTVFENIFERDT